MTKVYVATAWSNWPDAKGAADALAWLGMECTSTWITHAASGAVGDAQASEEQLKVSHETNYKDLDRSDALLVLRVAESGETFVEFAHALWNSTKKIVWLGRPVLSAAVNKDRVWFPKSRLEAMHMLQGLG